MYRVIVLSIKVKPFRLLEVIKYFTFCNCEGFASIRIGKVEDEDKLHFGDLKN